MPKLADLYGVDLNRLGKYRPEYTSVMERPLTDFEREQRAAPIDRPYASGQLEAPMFSPDDLIGSGVFTKLASLAKGLGPALAAGIIKNKGGVWDSPRTPFLEMVKGRPGYDEKSASVWEDAAFPVSFTGSPGFTRKMFEGKTPKEMYGAYLRSMPEEGSQYTMSQFLKLDPTMLGFANQRTVGRMANLHLSDPSRFPEMAASPDVIWKKWQRGPLVNYIRNQMATENDPIRALAEQGITHLAKVPSKNPALRPDLAQKRVEAGFPEEGVAKTPLGKMWEAIADRSISRRGPNEYGEIPYSFSNDHNQRNLHSNQLGSIADFVRKGIEEGRINPQSALRGNYSVESAVRDMHADRLARENVYKNATTFKEYPETGHKWVRLDKKGQFAEESDNMGHSVRGYETTSGYGYGGWEGIQSGQAEVYSLRGKSGKPIVTIEIDNSDPNQPLIKQVKGKFNKTSLPDDIEAMVQDFAEKRGATIASR